MNSRPTRALRATAGIASVEFAIVMPVLLLLLGGLTDFALAFWTRSLLANSVAAGAEYAYLAGSAVSTSDIQGVVGQRLSLPAAAITVTGPDCYCTSGTPATAAIQVCNQFCPNGAAPGTYVRISAQYTYKPILPGYSYVANTTLTESAMARLK